MLKKLSILLLALTVTPSMGASYKLIATTDGKAVGYGRFTSAFVNGREVRSLNLVLKKGAKSTMISDSTTYNQVGMPIHDELHITMAGKNAAITTDFTTSQATATLSIGGKVTHRKFPVIAGTTPVNQSNLWWITITPPLHRTVVACVFDGQSLSWKNHVITYEGLDTFTIHGKNIVGHRIYVQTGNTSQEIWNDDHGDLVKFVTGSLVLTRA